MEDSDKKNIQDLPDDTPAAEYQGMYGEKYLQKMAVSHTSEFAKKRETEFGKRYDDDEKKYSYTYLRGAVFRKMTAVWGTGVPGLPGKGDDPAFVYFHPVTFINHLFKLQTVKNPYLNMMYKDMYTWPDDFPVSDVKTDTVHDNPGLAPYAGKDQKMEYTTVNAFFNEDFGTYYHECVDFSGICGKTPVHALVYGTVVMLKNQGDRHYGLSMLIQGDEQEDGKNMFYLAGHLSRYAAGITVGSRVCPEMTVGYVGNTGNCYSGGHKVSEEERKAGRGTHLHVSVFKTDVSKCDLLYSNEKIIIELTEVI